MSNGILELVPFMRVLITEDAYFAGGDVLQNPEVYVLGNDGTLYKYSTFSLGRSSMIEVAKTPIVSKDGKSLLKPYLKALVNDQKIPVQMLTDIVEFFKRVMTMTKSSGHGHGEYEAMAHIVWNKTSESYRVAIPKQKVAKATVTYNWDHVASDEEVILDIHSHNTMGAFFSGTDERDDSTYVGISGVAGELDKVEPKLIWRFNAYRTKQTMALEGIFAMPEKSVSPAVENWMGNVEVHTYTPAYTGGSSVYGGGSRFGAGYVQSPLSKQRGNELDARFQGSLEEELTASTRTERSQASIDILGEDDGLYGGIHRLAALSESWDETADGLVNLVYSEEDDELNAAVAKRLGESVQDQEILFQEGVFLVSSASEARKAIARLTSDFDLSRGM